MPITLNQIPGYSDLADANFAAEQYALGINFARTVDNAKFGMVRPEIFVGRYINGDTVPLPTSTVDGYTYQREELSYAYSFALTGGTSTSSNGNPSQPGAIRYLAALVDQTTGAVTTNVEYLVADGRAPTLSNDGTLTVFTFATRRLNSLVVAAHPVYSPVLDSEVATDAAVTDSIMQRINRNAKFAALNTEILYMGEFTSGQTVPRPVSPADGYEYAYSEVTMLGFWRWTTPGYALVEASGQDRKQVSDIGYGINPANGAFSCDVNYYNNGYQLTNDGRLVVTAFCKRAMTPVTGSGTVQGLSGLGDGVVDFVDLTTDLLASGHAVREDVLERVVQNIRYAICRTEFFPHGATNPVSGNSPGTLGNGSVVPLPVSPIDGYQYSREELSYVWGYQQTANPTSGPRMYQWNCNVDQATGYVTSNIIRVPNGGAAQFSTDGNLVVMCIARRGHVSNVSDQYIYDGYGTGVNDITALQNGGFDAWTKNTDPIAQAWVVEQDSSTVVPPTSQQTGLVSGYSQRMCINPGETISIMSSAITVASNDLRYFGYVAKAYGTGVTSISSSALLSTIIHFYSPVGDTCSCVMNHYTPTGVTGQANGWVQIPVNGDTVVSTSEGAIAITGTLDFIPVTCRVEIVLTSSVANCVDLDEVTFISQLDPSLGQIAQRGSDSLAVLPAISFTVDDTSFTPSLNFYINRVDGSILYSSDALSESMQPSGTVGCTGLTASSTYYWYPYWDEILKFVTQVGDGAAAVGTPPYLQNTSTRALFLEWYSLSHLPLASSAIQVTTTAPAAPPVGGGGGGGGRCLRDNQWVKTKRGVIRVTEVVLGDELAGLGDTWLEVLHISQSAHSKWCELGFNHGGGMEVSTNHHFSTVTDRDDANDDEYKLVRAWDLTISTLIPWTEGVCHPSSITHKEEEGVQVDLIIAHPHRFLAGSSPDKLTLTTARTTERNCGCKETV